MLRATVDQNPTIPVSDGMKKRRNSALVWNFDGALKTGPSPPALLVIHQSSRIPTASMSGAATPSSRRMVLIPRQMTNMLSSQKEKKQIQMVSGCAAAPGHTTRSIEEMAWPPIHV